MFAFQYFSVVVDVAIGDDPDIVLSLRPCPRRFAELP